MRIRPIASPLNQLIRSFSEEHEDGRNGGKMYDRRRKDIEEWVEHESTFEIGLCGGDRECFDWESP